MPTASSAIVSSELGMGMQRAASLRRAHSANAHTASADVTAYSNECEVSVC